MKPILKNLSSYLDKMELSHDVREDSDAIIFSMGGSVADLNLLLRLQNDAILTITAVLPVNIPERVQPQILELINRVNVDALVSTMYLETEHKTVGCQGFLFVKNETIDEDMFTQCFYYTASRMNHYAEEILSIAYGNSTESLSELIIRKQIEESQREGVMN